MSKRKPTDPLPARRCATCRQPSESLRLQRRTSRGKVYRCWVCAGCAKPRRATAQAKKKCQMRPFDVRKRAGARWCRAYKKAQRCARCGFNEPSALDFHHPNPATKDTTVSALVQMGRPLGEVIAEAEKCVLLCANCHRIQHKRDLYADGTPSSPLPPAPHRPSGRTPKLCHHRGWDRGYVTDPRIGREVYFGKWGSPETKEAYRRWVEDFRANPAAKTVPPWVKGLDRQSRPCGGQELVVLLLAEAAARVAVDCARRVPPGNLPQALVELDRALEKLDQVRECRAATD